MTSKKAKTGLGAVGQRSRLVRWLARRYGRPDLAEDAAQDAYVHVFGQGVVDLRQYPESWIFTLARSSLIDRLRRGRFERPLPEDFADDAGEDHCEPERNVLRQQRIAVAKDLPERLSPSHRQILVMRYIRDMSREEIAAELSISIGAVEQRLTRALARCREDKLIRALDPGQDE